MDFTEAVTAMEAGCDIIKIFPGNIVDRLSSAASRGPCPRASSCPAALTRDNVLDKWIKADAHTRSVPEAVRPRRHYTGDSEAVTVKAQEVREGSCRSEKAIEIHPLPVFRTILYGDS